MHHVRERPTQVGPPRVWMTTSSTIHRTMVQRKNNAPVCNVNRSQKLYSVTHRLFDPQYRLPFKIFWVISTLLCVGICLYQIGVRVEYYLQEPGTIQLEMKRVLEVKFPSIVLCSSAMINAFKAFSEEWRQCQHDHKSCSPFVQDMLREFDDVDDDGRAMVNNLSTIQYENMKFGIHCPMFDAANNSCNGITVTERMSVGNIQTIWGSCLVLTLNESMEYRGPFTWISLVWNNSNISWTGVSDVGSFYFFLQTNDSSISRHDAIYLTETATFGYETIVRITVREFNFRNSRKKSCTANTADALNCMETCVDNKLNSTLKCRVPFLVNTNLNHCKSGKELVDAYAAADSVYTRLNSKDCTCIRRCHKMMYKVSVDGKTKMSKNQTKLKLLYSDDTHEVLTEKAIFALSELISEIGGTIGLYLGVCLITVFELFESLLKKCCCARKN